MALQYPLLFPFGIDGWVRGIPLAEGSSNRRESVPLLQYYAYRIKFRINEVNILLQRGRLFLQFIVDCYTVIEHERCLLYTSPSPRDGLLSRMPSSA